jgi:hypothetical protein
VNYVPAYALGVFGRLLALVDDPAVGLTLPTAPAIVEQARKALRADLERLLAWRVDTPQQAALSTIACLELGASDRVDPGWRALILGSQRPDGGWTGEPFAVIPNRGRTTTWYATAPLTTALCYDALLRGPGERPA